MPVRWETITARDFDVLPEAKPQRQADPDWDALLDALASGQHVRIPFAAGQHRRGLALALGRRAATRGFTVQLRYGEDFLAAKKGGDITPEPAAEELVGQTATKASPDRRGRHVARSAPAPGPHRQPDAAAGQAQANQAHDLATGEENPT